MSRLVLVRHGQSEWNAARRLQGQADPPLSRFGEQQARSLRPELARLGINYAICSDLRRAARTAELLGLDALPDPRWREIHVGNWAGESIDKLKAGEDGRWRDWRAGRLTPPNGEAWSCFQTRLAEALAALPEDDVLVVTHGGVVRAIVAQMLGVAPDRLAPVPPASATILERGTWPRLRAYGVGGEIGQGAPD